MALRSSPSMCARLWIASVVSRSGSSLRPRRHGHRSGKALTNLHRRSESGIPLILHLFSIPHSVALAATIFMREFYYWVSITAVDVNSGAGHKFSMRFRRAASQLSLSRQTSWEVLAFTRLNGSVNTEHKTEGPGFLYRQKMKALDVFLKQALSACIVLKRILTSNITTTAQQEFRKPRHPTIDPHKKVLIMSMLDYLHHIFY